MISVRANEALVKIVRDHMEFDPGEIHVPQPGERITGAFEKLLWPEGTTVNRSDGRLVVKQGMLQSANGELSQPANESLEEHQQQKESEL